MSLDDHSCTTFMEKIRKADLPLRSTMSVHITTVGKTLDRRGTSKQKRKHLPRICRGEILAYFAATSTAAFS